MQKIVSGVFFFILDPPHQFQLALCFFEDKMGQAVFCYEKIMVSNVD